MQNASVYLHSSLQVPPFQMPGLERGGRQWREKNTFASHSHQPEFPSWAGHDRIRQSQKTAHCPLGQRRGVSQENACYVSPMPVQFSLLSGPACVLQSPCHLWRSLVLLADPTALAARQKGSRVCNSLGLLTLKMHELQAWGRMVAKEQERASLV